MMPLHSCLVHLVLLVQVPSPVLVRDRTDEHLFVFACFCCCGVLWGEPGGTRGEHANSTQKGPGTSPDMLHDAGLEPTIFFFFFLQNLFIIFLIFHTDKTTGTYGRVREGQVQSILLKHNLGQSQINPNTNTGDKIPLNPPLSLKHTIPSTQTNNTHAQRGKGEEGKIK